MNRGVVRVTGWRALTVGALVAAVLMVGAVPASAVQPSGHGGHGGGAGGASTGNDVSYPQCGGSLPTGQAFGVVGVTGGLADTLNPCLGPDPSYSQSELYWAVATSVGGTTQPVASLYVNSADPGNTYNGSVIADWPTSGSTPFGTCTTTTVSLNGTTASVGANSEACAWQYGYDRAAQDAQWLASAASAIDAQGAPTAVSGSAGAYPWWLDVESANTWQSDTVMNAADLQGMIAGLNASGATTVGVYSTASQWDAITGGTTSASGSLVGVPEWVPGARTASGAQGNCAQYSFTGGVVTLAQWSGHPFDGDVAC
ncbi:MAG TPA: hypothetical protein PLS29_02990 [Acidimicrobiales bacterium]|nr:hypothetical protein [Acidimicrobiales bacterium]